jgi:hypothetical protein
MRRSTKVEIALVAGLALSGCGRRAYDPCAPQTFNELACQEAVSHNGYYSGGHWYPHTYYGGYSSYYNSYHSYIGGGGRITQVSPSEWSRPGGTGATAGSGATSGSSVSRGVFGSTGHGGGGGE